MGRPKALVDDWLTRSVATLRAGGCPRVLVVLGAEAAAARALLDAGPVPHPAEDVVVAADWADGMGASLRAGLSAAPSDAPGVLVHLVDLPDVGPDVVRRVLAAWSGPATAARAAYGDPADPRPGHPVLLGRDHLDAAGAVAGGDQGARRLLARVGATSVWCGDLAGGADVDHRP